MTWMLCYFYSYYKSVLSRYMPLRTATKRAVAHRNVAAPMDVDPSYMLQWVDLSRDLISMLFHIILTIWLLNGLNRLYHTPGKTGVVSIYHTVFVTVHIFDKSRQTNQNDGCVSVPWVNHSLRSSARNYTYVTVVLYSSLHRLCVL